MRSIASAAWSDSASSSRRWSGVSSGPGVVAVDADHADRRRGRCASAGTAAWRPAACRRRGRRACCSASTISPPRDRPRPARPPADSRRATASASPSSGSSSDDAHLQHQRDLVGGRPEQVVQRDGAGELAAEAVELLGGRARAAAPTSAWRAHPRGQVAGDHRDDGEEEQRDDVLGIGDGEGVERRQEEEVVGQHAERGRRTATATGRRRRRWPAPRSGRPARRW